VAASNASKLRIASTPALAWSSAARIMAIFLLAFVSDDLLTLDYEGTGRCEPMRGSGAN
jgi:hypothetical protein